jgi:hypothetical protein
MSSYAIYHEFIFDSFRLSVFQLQCVFDMATSIFGWRFIDWSSTPVAVMVVVPSNNIQSRQI